MPLNTQIIRDGKPLEVRWGGFHVAAIAIAASVDNGPEDCKLYQDPDSLFEELYDKGYVGEDNLASDRCDPIPVTPSMAFGLMDYGALSLTPLNEGTYVLKHGWKFVDVTDGEILELKPGDELVAYRSMK